MSSFLVRLFGFGATLVHGDTLVLDRWQWLKGRLPLTANGETALDVGCGSGAFTIGAARRGYHATGISWDERNQSVAQERARICRADKAKFVLGDVRTIELVEGLEEKYDVIFCLECIEHILDDRKVIADLAARLKPGGRLLVSAPNYYYVPMSKGDRGPFLTVETGWHVRRGYTAAMLHELCESAGLKYAEITHCSGYLSQQATRVWRFFERLPIGLPLQWGLTLPLRLLPLVLPEHWITRLLGWPCYSICVEVHMPRFGTTTTPSAAHQ